MINQVCSDACYLEIVRACVKVQMFILIKLPLTHFCLRPPWIISNHKTGLVTQICWKCTHNRSCMSYLSLNGWLNIGKSYLENLSVEIFQTRLDLRNPALNRGLDKMTLWFLFEPHFPTILWTLFTFVNRGFLKKPVGVTGLGTDIPNLPIINWNIL